MKKKYKIGQSNEIVKASKIYDLHNQYNFNRVVLIGDKRHLQLLFEPVQECRKKLLPITLHFEKLNYLEFSPNFGTRVIFGLDEIGYKKPGDFDDEWLMDEYQATSKDHLFFRLDGGDFIRIHCENTDLIEATKLTSITEST